MLEHKSKRIDYQIIKIIHQDPDLDTPTPYYSPQRYKLQGRYKIIYQNSLHNQRLEKAGTRPKNLFLIQKSPNYIDLGHKS